MQNGLARALGHVYWIGGSPCSGKSTIVEVLASRHTFQSYNCDDAFWRHGRQVTPEGQPTFHQVLQMTWDQLWMRPAEVLLADVLAVYKEEFPLILEDLLSLPDRSPIVAEGAALMPGLVHDVLLEARQAIWVVPTAAFQRRHYLDRGPWVQEILDQCTYPEQAFRNWMDRDAAFAQVVAAQAAQLGLNVLRVDGPRTIAEHAAIVEQHLRLP